MAIKGDEAMRTIFVYNARVGRVNAGNMMLRFKEGEVFQLEFSDFPVRPMTGEALRLPGFGCCVDFRVLDIKLDVQPKLLAGITAVKTFVYLDLHEKEAISYEDLSKYFKEWTLVRT